MNGNSIIRKTNETLHDAFDRLSGFASDFEMPAMRMSSSYTTYRDEKGNYIVEMAVPGYSKKDMDIDISNNVLTISSNNKDTHSSLMSRNIAKSFTLGSDCDVENITAEVKDGLLKVTVPTSSISRKVKIQ